MERSKSVRQWREGWRFVAVGFDATLLAAAGTSELARAGGPLLPPGGSP